MTGWVSQDKENTMPASPTVHPLPIWADRASFGKFHRMRVLKTIFIILLALVALLVIRGLFGSKTFRIERSTLIKAPAEMIYPKISSLKNMHDWSPWKEKDPNAKMTMEGTDGTIGASMSWEGNDDVGSGKQEITELVPNKSVRTALHFYKPWEAENVATFDLVPSGDSTKVTWGMEGENGFMMRVMSVFMDMDKMVGPDFEKGLSNLKKTTEEECAKMEAEMAEKIKAANITVTDRPAMMYVGNRAVVKFSDMHDFFMKSLPAAYEAAGKAKVKMSGAPVGLFYTYDETKMESDLLAGIPVPAEAKGKITGMQEVEIPACKAYTAVYTGPYEGSKAVHEAIALKMKMDNASLGGPVIEEYVTDPGHEPDSTKWVTNIIYPVK